MGLTAFNRMRRRNSEHVAQPVAEEPATVSFPDDCPGYDVLVENGLLTEEQVKNHEDLTALKGIGKKTQENIYAFFGWIPKEPDPTEPADPPDGENTPEGTADGETDPEDADEEESGEDTAAEEPGEDEYPKKLDGGVKLFSDGSKEQMSMEAAIKHEAELSGE